MGGRERERERDRGGYDDFWVDLAKRYSSFVSLSIDFVAPLTKC